MSIPRSGLTVLVVDDSATMRTALRELLIHAPGIAAVETAADGRAALGKMDRVDPDVVTMDIEMPGMDGLAALRQIMSTKPRPVIMLSAHTFQGADKTIRALEWGAVDFVQKPVGSEGPNLAAVAQELIPRILALGTSSRRQVRLRRIAPPVPRPAAVGTLATRVVAIGASTGGTEAIRVVLQGLPADLPAALVMVQHMPPGFTTSFSRRLDELCPVRVREATVGMPLENGVALLAPGHSHLLLRRAGGRIVTDLSRQNVGPHRPAVDVLFSSVARVCGSSAIGVILTGMGRDGAAGLLEMRECGAYTIGQDEASSVVYGMPKAAALDGAVVDEVDLNHIAALITAAVINPRSQRYEP